MKENEKVRKSARVANVPLWRVAHAIGVSEPTMTRWLRTPLHPERESKILKTIEQLSIGGLQ